MSNSTWHIITCEYPPQMGGVSDYTKLVAHGLADAGDEVHVWSPRAGEGSPDSSRVVVHRDLGTFGPGDLHRVGKQLDGYNGPRRLLVQWVPHGYTYRSMNLAFCFWLWKRAKVKGDRVELMVHEPFLAFGEGSRKQDVVAAVHRLMMMIILNAASHVWMSIPAWESMLRRYALGRAITFKWIPIPSNVPVVTDPARVLATRNRYVRNGNLLIGHFGTGERQVKNLLFAASTALFRKHPHAQILLMGRGSDLFIDELTSKAPELMGKIQATGSLSPNDLSLHVSACDLMLQPYPDGISSRRTSAMVGLSHGVPVITTTGHLTEPFWAASNAVALAPLDSVSSLPGLIGNLLSDPSERAQMGTVAKELYSERFDMRHTVKALRARCT